MIAVNDEESSRKTTKDNDMETFDNPIENSPVRPAGTNIKPKYGGITYVPGLSEQLANKLKAAAPELKIAFRSPYKVSSIFNDETENTGRRIVMCGL